jgi:Pro-kumamolisin, activation domain
MSGRRLPTIRLAPALTAALLTVATLAVVLLVVRWSHGGGTGTAPRAVAAARGLAAAGVAPVGTARRLGPYDRGTISFALALRLHERALNRYLAHVDPSARGGGLTAAQFGARFGQSGTALRRLRALLRHRGITVTQLYAQRTAMRVRARVTTVRRTFGVRLGRYETAAGIRYFAADTRPTVPAALAPYVSAVADLSSAPEPADDVPANGLTPRVTAKAYDITAPGRRSPSPALARSTPPICRRLPSRPASRSPMSRCARSTGAARMTPRTDPTSRSTSTCR